MHIHKRDFLISRYGYVGKLRMVGYVKLEKPLQEVIRSMEPSWRGRCMSSNYLLLLSEHATYSSLCPHRPLDVSTGSVRFVRSDRALMITVCASVFALIDGN
jgi:hypothetical protein